MTNAVFKISADASVSIEIAMHDGRVAQGNISFDHLAALYRSAMLARIDSLSNLSQPAHQSVS